MSLPFTSKSTRSSQKILNWLVIARFARGPLHRDAAKAFNALNEGGANYSLWHELFEVKEGGSEALYINTKPHGLGAIWNEVESKEGGVEWQSVLREATGKALSSASRMSGKLWLCGFSDCGCSCTTVILVTRSSASLSSLSISCERTTEPSSVLMFQCRLIW